MIEKRFVTLGLVISLGILALIQSTNLQNTDMVQASRISRPVSPAGSSSANMTGNMTGNMTSAGELGIPAANPIGSEIAGPEGITDLKP